MRGEEPASFATREEAELAVVKSELNGLVDAIAANDVPRHEALRLARQGHPEIYSRLTGFAQPVTKAERMNDFQKAVAAEMDWSGCDELTAMRTVRRFRPEMCKGYDGGPQAQDRRLGAPTNDRPGHDGERAKQLWLDAVEKCRLANPGMSSTAVLTKTRTENPALFSAYQNQAGGGSTFDHPQSDWEDVGNR